MSRSFYIIVYHLAFSSFLVAWHFGLLVTLMVACALRLAFWGPKPPAFANQAKPTKTRKATPGDLTLLGTFPHQRKSDQRRSTYPAKSVFLLVERAKRRRVQA